MFRATLIHCFAVYCMFLTLDIGFSTQQDMYPDILVKINMESVEIEKRGIHNEDMIENQNPGLHPREEYKINTTQEKPNNETAHSVLVRFASGSKKGPIDEKPKDYESHSNIDNNKYYGENHYRAMRHTEIDDDTTNEDADEDTDADTDEDREPESFQKHSGNNENEVSKNSFEDVDSDEKDTNDDELDTNENSTTKDITKPTNITNESDSTHNNSTTNGTVPNEWDWRKNGFETAVGDQERGNFCWAFAASGVVEGYNFIKTGQLETLSMQQLIDCDKVIEPEGNGFTGGHSVESSFKYVKKYGIETNESYPFTGQEGTECRYDAEKGVTKISKYTSLMPANEIEMQRILVTYGPIVVQINAGDLVRTPNVYQGGIYEGCNNETSTETIHAVVAVGYGTDNGKDYWILKNSWGTKFGEQGYFKLPRNINACQITQDVLYVE